MPSNAYNLLQEAIQDLDINNPVLNFTVRGNTVTIWFLAYPEPVEWSRPAAARRGDPRGRPTKASA